LGGPVNRHNPDAKENLPKIRQLLRDGRIPEAEHLMETALSACPEGMHPYQTLGDVQFFFDGIEGGRERKSGKLRDMILCEGTKHYER
jgi:alpha-L-fucosidase 2